MKSSMIFSVVTFVYFASFIFYLIYFFLRDKITSFLSTSTAALGLVLQIIAFFLRWKESYQMGIGHIPLSNLYESLIFFTIMTVLIYLIIEYIYKIKVVGAFVMIFPVLTLAFCSLYVPNEIEPLVPALQSNWLTAHVVTCFLSYAAFAISCGISILYFLKLKFPNKLNFVKSLDILDDLIYKSIAIGFPMLSLGIITGAAWANYAWGTYWSWDPKETWSLITWFVYAAFLHARFTKGWRGKKAALLSIIGFGSVLFTYLGVNLILSGLHSYGSL
jgi:cytochrome c-type biogenesis protein CcsB